MAESDINTQNELQNFYSLYIFQSQSAAENTEEKKETNEGSGFSLSLVLSDLPVPVEQDLHQFLFSRVAKGLLYDDTGCISTFNYNEGGEEKEMSCYYCKLSGADTSNVEINVGQGDTGNGGRPKTHIVCFLTSHDNILDQFRSELDMYALGVYKFLELENEAQTKTYLGKWSHETTEYLCRCLTLLKRDIKYLLFASLTDAELVFNGITNDVQQDLLRFAKTCSLSDVLKQVDSPLGSLDMLVDLGETNQEKKKKVELKLNGNNITISPEYCTKFCEDWGFSICSANSNNPGQIRQIIEAGKLKFTQSINTLKRLLMQAETDYYALYRAYVFLKNSGNSEILLTCSHLESIPETYNVFRSLEEFIRETEVK